MPPCLAGGSIQILTLTRDITERAGRGGMRASEEKYRLTHQDFEGYHLDDRPSGPVDVYQQQRGERDRIPGRRGYRQDRLGLPGHQVPADLRTGKAGQRRRGEEVPPYEVLVVGRDGRHTPSEFATAPIVDDRGSIVGVQGAVPGHHGAEEGGRGVAHCKHDVGE